MNWMYQIAAVRGILGVCFICLACGAYVVEDGPLWTRLDKSAVRGGDGVCFGLYDPNNCPEYGSSTCKKNGTCSNDPAPQCQSAEFTRSLWEEYYVGYRDWLETGAESASYQHGYCKVTQYCEKDKTCGYDGSWYCKKSWDSRSEPITDYSLKGTCPD